MSCQDLSRARVGDDPAEQARFRRHAEDCADCARLLEADRRLAEFVDRWRRRTPGPPASLERRIADALARRQADLDTAKVVPLRSESPPAGDGWRWGRVAAAALLLLLATAIAFNVLRAPRGELERAVVEVERSEERLARAIAELERQAQRVLEQAGDPALPADRAAILLRYSDRLRHLDSVIAEVQGFLDDNPGQSRGHTVLLAAYREKNELLREVLDLPSGDAS